jgi:cation diffusion facilitator CzcD-associated flavoprotein CzcO
MRDYIMGFAAHHGLGSHIRFNTAVTSVWPLDATGLAGWEVTTSDGERRAYDGVVVANGHLWDPFVPDYPGRFAGHVLHSGRYRNVDDIEGDRVLVVGAGNSGCDLAVDAAQAGRETYVSVRNGLVFQPKTLFGRPRSELPWLARLPIRVQERVTRALSTSLSGGPSATGCRRRPRATCTATARSSMPSSCTSSTTAASASRPASSASTATTCTSPTAAAVPSTRSSTRPGSR